MKTPNIVETLKFEEILSRMKEELMRRDASFSALTESDPAIKILEVAAWRELLLRQRINDAAQANLLAFARGNDLDHLAEFYGVLRKESENDESLRKRVKAKIVGWSTAGSKEHYRYHALSADTRVKDAQVVSTIPGSVQISIFSTENDGVPSEELLEIVRNHVIRDDIRVLTDTLTVIGCGIIPITIHAKVHIYPTASKDVIEAAKEQFIKDLESAKGLGWNVTRSWIIAHLFIEGMQNIELTEPIEDIVVRDNECVTLNNLSVR
ncbi:MULTISPECIES: baseplate J/gp47 family protein [unclassified Wolbachia]|uniref:baseplate assembly protein n=1 Tax=unclassified Wolbachia TaxID=2640676 RepID=UPI00221F0960|nr:MULTISPECIES: baseplate J/gp47 family protein [unclassified Wolbachia]